MLVLAALVAPAIAAPAEADLVQLRAALKAQQEQLDAMSKSMAAQNRIIEKLQAERAVEHAKREPESKPAASPAGATGAAPAKAPRSWFDRIRLQGYTQVRSASVVDGDRTLVHDGDPSIDPETSLFIRRARLIFLGDISERMFIYVQPDLASSAGGDNVNFAQLRDVYADVFVDDDREFRLRIGQSKVPYSFEALQSSQNRLTLERNDAVNSAWNQERDLGALFYWSPKKQRELLVHLRNNKLKGSGEYGVLGLGVVNGQGNNRADTNDDMHVVGRFTWPHRFENGQIVEGGLAAFSGRFVPRVSTLRVGNRNVAVDPGPVGGIRDERVNAHLVLYPQPFGLQAEYNVGRGPELDPATFVVGQQNLHGGYVQACYKLGSGSSTFFPFVKYQKFDGAKKNATNAPPSLVREWDLGVEWQPGTDYELVLQYKDTRRSDLSAFPFPVKQAELLQLHFQLNY